MSNTTNIDVNNTGAWVEVSATSGSSVMSATHGCQYVVSDTTPESEVVGHRFTGDLVPFTLLEGESLYVKACRKTTIILSGGLEQGLTTHTSTYSDTYS